MKNIGIKVSLISPSVLYAKENAIHVQKRQDREEKKRKKDTKIDQTPIYSAQTQKKKRKKTIFLKKDQTSRKLTPSSQGSRNLFNFFFQISELRNFGSFSPQQKAEL